MQQVVFNLDQQLFLSNTKQQFRLLLRVSDMGKHYSAYCFAWFCMAYLSWLVA